MTGRDAAREQLTALLIALWEEDAGESLDGLDGVSEAIDAYLARLLPVVDRIKTEYAAAVLRAAAQEQRNEATTVPDVVEGHAGGHICAADFLDRRADALDPS